MSGLIADSRTMIDKARVEAQVSSYTVQWMFNKPQVNKLQFTVHIFFLNLLQICSQLNWD